LVLLDQLSVSYAGHPVVGPLTLTAQAGERIGIAGASGAGKTTLLTTIARLPGAGASIAGKIEVSGRIGYIPQEATHSLSPYLRVVDQVAEIAGSRAKASTLLTAAGLDGRRQESYPHQLSGGERQRVLVQQAVAADPRVILADEPTANLDEANEALVLDLLANCVERSGASLMIASHRENVFERLQCRVVRLTPEWLATPLPSVPHVAADARTVVRFEKLTKTYSTRDFFLRTRRGPRILDEVSLEIRAGEMVALTGPSGSGKTTLARCLAGRESFDSGHLERLGVQLVQQEPSESLNPTCTLSAVLREASPRGDAAVLEKIGLAKEWMGRKVAELSEGQRSRVAIARAVSAAGEGLLILDESLASLDGATVQTVVAYVREAQRESGMACLVISHRQDIVRVFAHRVLTMRSGHIEGPAQ
jgi:peptide/nickel transport system ATP-binding protein